MMKSLLLSIAFVFAGTSNVIKDELPLGSKAPLTDVKMLDISGKSYSLLDLKGENGLLVIFSCNTCPYVLAWEDRYDDISALAKSSKIGFVAVNSNAAQHDGVDSIEEMKKHAMKMKYDFPYVLDKNATLADAFGATRTPHVFLFDKDLTLVYRGAIDDNSRSAEKVKEPWLMDAMKAVASGKPIAKSSSKAIGCTIKRATKS
jgi:peroxiredoxin